MIAAFAQRLLLVPAALATLALALTGAPARAQTEVDVNQANVQPLPIAIPVFGGSGQVGSDIAQVVSADLERSGLFRPLDSATFPEKNLDIRATPKFDSWRAIGAQAVVNGHADLATDGRLEVGIHLFDVGQQKELDIGHGQNGPAGLEFFATPDNWRKIAHKIADAVYEQLTGEKGYFDTRIVFVAESGPKTNRIKRLAIMDQDGANPQYLTDGSYMVMSPRFSANSQEITYMALRPTGATVYLFNIETGRQETVGRYTGMVMAPRFSPDGRKVAFAVERYGNVDIYAMNLETRETKRLTADPNIDTSPSFSPNGGQIVFNSDRSGSPQIYVMNADGSGVHRISFGQGRYTSPVWGPNGDYIAFTKQTGSTFHIGVMRPDGSDERILTTSYLDEGPTWAPNGRVLMFERGDPSSNSHLWMVDITGRILRQVPYPTAASDPAWSPLLE
jgi:TolB protein